MTIEELVASVLNVPLSFITNATGPDTLREWNSLKHLELIAAFEEAYGIQLTTREMQRLTSVRDLQRILQQRSSDRPKKNE